jgi:hypothetical protein
MPDAAGPTDATVDDLASQLYARTPRSMAGQIGMSEQDREAWSRNAWEEAPPTLHEIFRARAIRMLNGDFSVMPLTWPIGMAAR